MAPRRVETRAWHQGESRGVLAGSKFERLLQSCMAAREVGRDARHDGKSTEMP